MKSFHKSPNRFLLLGLTSALLIGTATAAQAPEIQRHYYNSERLGKMHPWAQPKVAAVISDLESHGDHPVIQESVWRTPAQQAALKKAGRSTVSYSFHTVTGSRSLKYPQGKPEALAADIADFYTGYNAGNPFWMRLASAAQNHQMTTGIYWGLSQLNRDKISEAIASKYWTAPITRGWDPSHAEPAPWVITLSQAKAGKRPPLPLQKPPRK